MRPKENTENITNKIMLMMITTMSKTTSYRNVISCVTSGFDCGKADHEIFDRYTLENGAQQIVSNRRNIPAERRYNCYFSSDFQCLLVASYFQNTILSLRRFRK